MPATFESCACTTAAVSVLMCWFLCDFCFLRADCESKYGGIFYLGITEQIESHLPERSSVASAPFIVACGLHMLLFWRHESGLLHFISALFAVNGIGAFFAHWYATTMWHNFDSKTMLLAVWLAYCLIFSECMENLFRVTSATGRCARKFRDTITAANWLVAVTIYFWLGEANAAVGVNEYGQQVGALGSAVPLAFCLVAGLMHTACGCGRSHSMTEATYRGARFRFHLGLFTAFAGAVVWSLTEQMCDRADAVGTLFRWFPGHFVWHVSCAYGLCNALLFAGVLRADNFNTEVAIQTNNFYFALLPRMLFDPTAGMLAVASQATMEEALTHDATPPPVPPAAASSAAAKGGGERGGGDLVETLQLTQGEDGRSMGSFRFGMRRVAVEPPRLSPPPSPPEQAVDAAL